jgi:hypothetical protein
MTPGERLRNHIWIIKDFLLCLGVQRKSGAKLSEIFAISNAADNRNAATQQRMPPFPGNASVQEADA